MSCCGRGTTTPGGATSSPPRRLHGRRSPRSAGSQAAFYLRYTGPSHLTARGPYSGRSYRFGTPGAILAVDPRDLRSLEMVPGLERVGDWPARR